MMRTLRCLILAVPLSLAVVCQLGAQEVKSDGISLGTHIMGSKLMPADLKGRVIFLEQWGIN